MFVCRLMTAISAIAIVEMSRQYCPSGTFVAPTELATVRGGAWCEVPVPVSNACLVCKAVDDPATRWGHCNGFSTSYKCQVYSNPNPHYATDCRDGSTICSGSRYEYSDDECDVMISMNPYPGCHDGVPYVRVYETDYVGNAGPVGYCP